MADLPGFDLSQWQSGAYAGGGGFAFGIVKLIEGVGFKDPAADRHMAAILAQPIVPGGYAFTRPDLNPGTAGAYAEADWFWRVATSYGGARGMLLADDAESAGGSAQWCEDFRGRLAWRLGGYNALLYSYWAWLTSRGIVGAAVLAQSPLWIAWPDSNGPLPGVAVSMQQYGLVSVPGIQGGVDGDRFFGTIDQLKALTVGGGIDMALDPNDPVVQELLGWIQGSYWLGRSGYDGDPTATPAPAHYSIFKDVPAALVAVQNALGIEKAEVDAISANMAAATQATALLSAVADLKTAVAALPGGSEAQQPVLDAIAAVDKHVQATATHLGVGNP